ncbi:MAG: SDR family NAD(P)-dependent oxidoreductase [Halioglobus sp.]|nr:SDR family NAD(P)-dependent oxidoreductase [Halioglobus sp.]
MPEVQRFAAEYRAYFERNGHPGLQILDQAPRFAIWREHGTLTFGSSVKECGIVADIARHTRWCIHTGEALGGWQALPEKDIFDLEYWSLEQAKLGKDTGLSKPHQGKVALVTGAYSGIGRATCNALSADGATVVGLDINPAVAGELEAEGMHGLVCDLTEDAAMRSAVETCVGLFGGLDIVVCNAGVFQSGERIEHHSAKTWDQAMAVNLTRYPAIADSHGPLSEAGHRALPVGSGIAQLRRARHRRRCLFGKQGGCYPVGTGSGAGTGRRRRSRKRGAPGRRVRYRPVDRRSAGAVGRALRHDGRTVQGEKPPGERDQCPRCGASAIDGGK